MVISFCGSIKRRFEICRQARHAQTRGCAHLYISCTGLYKSRAVRSLRRLCFSSVRLRKSDAFRGAALCRGFLPFSSPKSSADFSAYKNFRDLSRKFFVYLAAQRSLFISGSLRQQPQQQRSHRPWGYCPYR